MLHRPHAIPAAFLLISCLIGSGARAQREPTLNDLVAQWSQGSFRSPLMCELQGKLIRGVRRVLIRSQNISDGSPRLTLELIDLNPGEATRCIDATGAQVPNLTGTLQLRREGHAHPETARRDFKRVLKQNKGFAYRIVSGTVKIQAVRIPAPDSRLVDFQGGSVTLSLIFPATDPARALADFRSGRKLLVTLQSKSGEEFVLPLFDPAAPPP